MVRHTVRRRALSAAGIAVASLMTLSPGSTGPSLRPHALGPSRSGETNGIAFERPGMAVPPESREPRRELIVRLGSDTPQRRLREAGLRVIDRSRTVPGLHLVEASRAWNGKSVASRVREMFGVKYAEQNALLSMAALPSDPAFEQQWALHNEGQDVDRQAGVPDADIDAVEAWDTTTGRSDVTVAVIDTGIDLEHPDLQANLWANPGESGMGRENNAVDDDLNGFVDDFQGWDFGDDDNVPDDLIGPLPHGHGTHVAGIIGAIGDNATGIAGVSWRVGLIPVRVASPEGQVDVWTLLRAFEYGARAGADVINASISWRRWPSQATSEVIAAASDSLFVFAAGNSGADNDVYPSSYPCSYAAANVVCVANTDNQDQLHRGSNYGRRNVDLAAPGTDIVSTMPGDAIGYLTGTSMAAPHVAGTTALLKAAAPGASTAELKDALLRGADPLASLEERVGSGGRLNAARSLQELQDGSTARQPATYSRRLTLRLRKHLTAYGTVRSPSPLCEQSARVSVYKKQDREWSLVASTRSGSDGIFRLRLPDRAGAYRAFARGTYPGGNTLCLESVSPRLIHRH